ncbi:MAG: CPBP family intramembrane metalloprotease [Pirellulales bacterium]|nr:CPBP family intramembrane metalloprotease [Pirellulales bacterium]
MPIQKRRRPFWTPADFLILLGTQFLLIGLAFQAFVSAGWIELAQGDKPVTASSVQSVMASTTAVTIGGAGALLVTLAWLRICNRNWRQELALSVTTWDLKLGLSGALLILPPVLMLSYLVSKWVAYEHPVLERLATAATPQVFLLIFGSTAILTPIVEEFAFRLLLQGGLQGLADRQCDEDGMWAPRAYWPMIVTSVLFAAMHLGDQGAAPIPLFFLSLGLGYLYRQSGRIAVPILVHMILNGLTISVVFLQLQLAPQTP